MKFDSLLLAGGASTRMGRDKALLPMGGGLLWERQVEILRALGSAEFFISGPARPGFPSDVILLPDRKPGLGPLAGIVEGLRRTQMPLLLVLAVDLPAMTGEYLSRILALCDSRGCVPQHDGWFEPLAAVYPKAALDLAERALQSEDRSLQSLVTTLLDQQMVSLLKVERADAGFFTNWNKGAQPMPPE